MTFVAGEDSENSFDLCVASNKPTMIGGVIILTKGRRNKKNRSEVQIELERDASSFSFFPWVQKYLWFLLEFVS